MRAGADPGFPRGEQQTPEEVRPPIIWQPIILTGPLYPAHQHVHAVEVGTESRYELSEKSKILCGCNSWFLNLIAQ